MAKNILARLFLFGFILASLVPIISFSAGLPNLGPESFGGQILSIVPILINPFCPANVGFVVAIGPPSPIVITVPAIVPPLVINGPAAIGAWTIGLATPGIGSCLPIGFLIGVSRSLP